VVLQTREPDHQGVTIVGAEKAIVRFPLVSLPMEMVASSTSPLESCAWKVLDWPLLSDAEVLVEAPVPSKERLLIITELWSVETMRPMDTEASVLIPTQYTVRLTP
jgi:hypothetical protein